MSFFSIRLLPAIMLICLTWVSLLSAEPYIAVREGFKCSLCHVNRTGGGKRNAFGTFFSQTTLIGETAPDKEAFTGRLNPFISIGGDFRTSFLARDIPNQTNTSEFKTNEGQLYLEVTLIPGEVTLYVDQRFAPGASIALEAFALLGGFSEQTYIKAGKFFLPFGLRLEDDTAFVRSTPQINMINPDTGLEVGLAPGDFSLAFALSNGNAGGTEDNESKQLTLTGAWVVSAVQMGVSYANNKDATDTERDALSLFGGFTAGAITVLAEGNLVSDDLPGGGEREQQAVLAELNWLVAQGMNLKFTYEWNDPNEAVSEDERQRVSVVFEPFLRGFTQLRVGVRINESIPQNDLQNADDLFVELHLFF